MSEIIMITQNLDKLNNLQDGDEVTIEPGVYVTGPLRLTGLTGVNITMADGVVVQANDKLSSDWIGTDGQYGRGDAIINITDCTKLRLTGGLLKGADVDYSDSEHRHGIRVDSSDNIFLTTIKIHKTGGDGVYSLTSDDCVTDGVQTDEVLRNGFSLISGSDIPVKNCVFLRSGHAGIDIESNRETDIISNVTLTNNIAQESAAYDFIAQLVHASVDHSALIRGTGNQFEKIRINSKQVDVRLVGDE